MANYKAERINLNLKCPCCKSTDMTTAGNGVGKDYKVKKRYFCKKCGSYTVNPIKQ
jgi:transposase-like protein